MRTVIAAALIAAIGASSSAVLARDMTGKGGIGMLQSTHPELSRLPMLLFRYWSRKTSWEVMVGFDLASDRGQTAVYYKTAPTQQVFLLDSAVPSLGAANTTVDHVEPWFFDATHIYLGLGAHRMIHDTSHLSVTLGLRGVMQFSSVESKARNVAAQGKLTSALGLLAEVPLQAEYFLSDHSSLTASVALTASISSSFQATNSKDGGFKDLLGSSGTTRGGVSLKFGGRYSGGVGFTYYF